MSKFLVCGDCGTGTTEYRAGELGNQWYYYDCEKCNLEFRYKKSKYKKLTLKNLEKRIERLERKGK